VLFLGAPIFADLRQSRDQNGMPAVIWFV
jgi:hypothetical protein